MPLCSSKPLIFVWSLFNRRKEDSPHESCNVYTIKDASIPDHCHVMEMIPNAKTAGGGSVARKEGRKGRRKEGDLLAKAVESTLAEPQSCGGATHSLLATP